MPKVVSIVGPSGSGKTTLIENVIPILTSAGVKVVVIKHAAKGFEIDKKGTDSYRIFKSGADVAVISGDRFAMVKRVENWNLENLLHFFTDYDLVLTEGFSGGRYPKILVVGEESEKEVKNEKDVSPPIIGRVRSDKVKDSETVRRVGELILRMVGSKSDKARDAGKFGEEGER